MRVACLTSNQPRHLSLVEALVEAGHDVSAIIEPKPFYPGGDSAILRTYWAYVREAELSVFGDRCWSKVPTVTVRPGEINQLPFSVMQAVLQSDRVVVFGCGYLRGEFADALIAGGALNLHAGISPEFRGSAPNFWAEYTGHSDLVGAQVQRLSRRLDDGVIHASVTIHKLFHENPFHRGMVAVQRGISLMCGVLERPKGEIGTVDVTGRTLIRYSRYADFTEDVVREYLDRIGR